MQREDKSAYAEFAGSVYTVSNYIPLLKAIPKLEVLSMSAYPVLLFVMAYCRILIHSMHDEIAIGPTDYTACMQSRIRLETGCGQVV